MKTLREFSLPRANRSSHNDFTTPKIPKSWLKLLKSSNSQFRKQHKFRNNDSHSGLFERNNLKKWQNNSEICELTQMTPNVWQILSQKTPIRWRKNKTIALSEQKFYETDASFATLEWKSYNNFVQSKSSRRTANRDKCQVSPMAQKARNWREDSVKPSSSVQFREMSMKPCLLDQTVALPSERIFKRLPNSHQYVSK